MSPMNLAQALLVGSEPELIAFIGGGGKSSLMLALAEQLEGRVVLTTTTRMFAQQIEEASSILGAPICTYPDLNALQRTDNKAIVVGPPMEDKVTGVPRDLPQQLLRQHAADVVVVEADGSKMLPVKAPAAHEPALPVGVTLVVAVAGIDALGGRIAAVTHRPELVAQMLGKEVSASLTEADLALLLSHERAALKDVPVGARVIPVINKVDTALRLGSARHISRQVLQQLRVEQVLLCSVSAPNRVVEIRRRVTAVILAAGQSERMGRSKQLLPWGETTVLGRTLQNLQESGIFECLVVTGAEAERVGAVAQAAGVPTVHNAEYADGEMLSSLQTAVTQLPESTSAVLVVLADQPMVGASIIDQLLDAYARGVGTIIAPEYEGRRGNPVLLDRRHFKELLDLPRGAAPRDLLRRHPVSMVPVESAAVLQDIDNLQDYARHSPG